jgi:hypothetical protein
MICTVTTGAYPKPPSLPSGRQATGHRVFDRSAEQRVTPALARDNHRQPTFSLSPAVQSHTICDAYFHKEARIKGWAVDTGTTRSAHSPALIASAARRMPGQKAAPRNARDSSALADPTAISGGVGTQCDQACLLVSIFPEEERSDARDVCSRRPSDRKSD